MALFNKLTRSYRAVGQYLATASFTPTDKQAQMILFAFGIGILSLGLSADSLAAFEAPGQYNDERIAIGINRIYMYIEGAFGALIMIAAGLGAIISAAFGQYRAALALLVVAVGAFILRSLVSTFFNTESIENNAFGV